MLPQTISKRARRRRLAPWALVLAAATQLACQGGPSGPPTMSADAAAPPTLGFDLAAATVVDLSWPLGHDTLFWPTSTETFSLSVVHHGPTDGGYFYAANNFCAPEHGGTHLDAPLHFAEQGHPVDAIPLDHLVAPVVVIDVTEAAAADPDYLLEPAAVIAWEDTHAQIPAGAIVLLRTGWGKRWPDRALYFGSAEVGSAADLHFPSFGVDAARLLIEERGVVALGLDTASIDGGRSTDFQVHRLAAAANVPGLENLAHLEDLPATGAWLAALPVKIEGGSGGPARVVAFVPAE